MAKVMVSFPEEFLKRVDRQAKAQNRSRSELIREALRRELDERNGRRLPWGKALSRLKWLENEWTGRWDSTEVIRRDRESGHGRNDRP
ncbi:MAG: CopG family ribbon-helix-helix protein [Thermoanaerobaculia bacterium]